MKKLLAIAALLLASTTAQAQYTFDYGGKTIRIDPDRGTVQIPGVYDNTRKAKRPRDDDDDDNGRRAKRYRDDDDDAGRKTTKRSRDDDDDDYRDRPRRRAPQDARTSPPPAEPDRPAPAARAPSEQAAVPPAPPPAPAAPSLAVPAAPAPAPAEPSSSTAAVAPADTAPPAPPPPSAAPPSQVQQEPPPAPRPSVAAISPPPSTSDPDSPVGIWQTEKKDGKDGKVRIEQCGANLCGYSIDRKTGRNGEQVLINMRPGKDKWTGRIVDPSSGSKYDSTIALKGTDRLRVQGLSLIHISETTRPY